MKRTLVKQIRNGEVVEKLLEKGLGYFYWLQEKSGCGGALSSMLAETVFVSVDGLDDILVDKTKEEIRRKYAEDIAEQEDLNDKDAETIYKSIRGDCCLFEIILCLAFSLNEMFEDFDAFDGPSHFFGMMMSNAGFDLYDDEDLDSIGEQVKEYWQRCIDRILKREYGVDGKLSLFCLKEPYKERDFNKISLWKQLNIWVDQHTNEDGEWVD